MRTRTRIRPLRRAHGARGGVECLGHKKALGDLLMGGKKTLEEEMAALVRAEFAGVISGLERDRAEYRHRLSLKEEARRALDDAEAEALRLHSKRRAFEDRFWEAYYGRGEVPFSEVGSEPKSLGRAVERAEKALRKASADFERADFDEVAEEAALKERLEATVDKAGLRVGEIQEAREKILAGVWLDVNESSQALRVEVEEALQEPQESPATDEGPPEAQEEDATDAPDEDMHATPQSPERQSWWRR